MSSNLTSVSINKNKSRFAPKVKARPTSKRTPGNDATTSTSSSSSSTAKPSLPTTEPLDRDSIATTAVKALGDSSIQSDKIDETLRQLSSSTIPRVANATDLASISSSIVQTTATTSITATTETTSTTETTAATATTTATTAKKSTAKRRPSKASQSSGTPIVIGTPSKSSSSSAKPTTNISAPINKRQRSVTSSRTETADTLNSPDSSEEDEQTAADGLTKRQKVMKNIKAAMKKSDKTPISTPTKSTKPTSGNSFAAPSNTTPTSSTSTSTSTTIAATSSSASSTATAVASPARRRRVKAVQREPSADDSELDLAESVVDEDDELSDESDGDYTDINLNAADVRRKRRLARARRETSKRKKNEVLLAKDMKTLDDLTADPLIPEDLDRNIKYFLKDLPRGVVTKQFRDEQIEREQEQLQRAEEAAALKNDQDALGRLAEQRQALQLQKEKDEEAERVKKAQEEKEQRKKQQQQQLQASGLSESNHALQVRMVNGQIVLDTDSMMIDQNKDREEISHEHMEVVEENAQSRKVNSRTYGKNTGNKRWTAEETDLFYKLLSQFGTDFEMMAQMIPNRSRIQVRLKYNKEQRVNPEKVTEYLIRKKEPLDLETFKQVTGLEFEKVPDHFHTLQLA